MTLRAFRAIFQKIRKFLGFKRPVQNLPAYRLSMDELGQRALNDLRMDMANDYVQENYAGEVQEDEKDQAEVQIEVIRCLTFISVACIVGTYFEPDVMSPYIDKLLPLVTFLIGYFFPAS